MKYIALAASALTLWAGAACAQQRAEEQVHRNHDEHELLSPPQLQPEPGKQWELKTGFLIETENVEGKSDNKGFWEPTVYLEAKREEWTIYGAYYQENHNTSGYYTTQGRSNWYNQYELNLRYLLLSGEGYEFGLQAGARNYQWQYNGNTNGKKNSYNTQRYTLQPDWQIGRSENITFSGWMALYNYVNHVGDNAINDKELEGETGFGHTFNDVVGIKMNYYIDRGWNTGRDRRTEFSQQELRLYLPLTLSVWHNNATVMTPYLRHSLNTHYYNSDRHENDTETDSRFGLLIEQALPYGLSLSLEYAYELQRHDHPDAANTRYHYTGVGMAYTF